MTGLVLTVVARPLSVLASSIVQPMALRDLGFISWAGLRGAVPIVLATIPLAEGVDGADDLFDIVFVMVVVYTLLTGPTLPWSARWLGVARRSEPRGLEVEAAPLDRVAADLLQVTIAPTSKMHGVEVGELRLPPGASVSLVIRERRVARAGASYGPARRRRPPRRHPAQAARGDRGAAAPGLAERPARPVARRPVAARPATDAGRAGSLGAGGLAVGGVRLGEHRLDLLLAQLLELLAHHDHDPAPDRVAGRRPWPA